MGNSSSKRRSSLNIALVLISAAALQGCGEDLKEQRDVYTNLADCQKDWGNPQQCEPVRDGRHSNSYFYGPTYSGSSFSSGTPRPSKHALEATRVSRGGFGSSVAMHSGGG